MSEQNIASQWLSQKLKEGGFRKKLKQFDAV